ncbi:MAG: zinc-ribbon domain-containing protein, partial [Candidatus Dormibacteria bacterium]
CGTENAATAKFCANCGANMQATAAPAAGSESPPESSPPPGPGPEASA